MEQLIKYVTGSCHSTAPNPPTRGPRLWGPPSRVTPFTQPKPWRRRTASATRHFIGGQMIVELLVAFGLASILLPAIMVGFVSGSSGKVQQQQRLKAVGYLEEGSEAVRSVREADWNNISTNGTYHPVVSGNAWTLSGGAETFGDFTRKIDIEDAVPIDPSKKQITVTVSWNNILPANVTSVFILTRWKNISSPLTTSGTLLNQGSGDWCTPTLNITALDLPKNGVANAVSAIQGQIAAGTGDNASGVSYANVTVSDPAAPTNPTAVISGTFDGYKTNEVFTEQNYAYLATDTSSKDVVIIDLTHKDANNKYSEAGYVDILFAGNVNAASVATSGSVGYVVGGTHLYSFDLTSKSGQRSLDDPDGVTFVGNASRMVIWGQRAYITTSDLSGQLVIADIGNPADLKIKTTVGLPAAGGAAVYVNKEGTRAYVATHESASQRELFIVNTDETSPQFGTVINSYDTNGMNPKGVVVVNIPRVIVVGTGEEEYQVIDITDENANPLPRCGGLQVDTGVNGVATVFTVAQRAYSYIITGDATSELKIIEGGPGGGGTGGGLIVESPIIDAGHTATFNRIDITNLTPAGITATYQVAVSTDCLTFSYTGNYTVNGGPIPLSINPGRCFRYKVTFSGGSGVSTIASTTVSVNYSP